MNKKVLAIASVGGHWIQLLRLRPAFNNCEVVFVSTKESFSEMVPGNKFYAVPDSNRGNKVGLIKSFFKLIKIIISEKPDVIITTGASPGLLGIFGGKILGIKTIWIDSIANVEQISLSGKIASKFASKVYTQWPDLATKGIHYSGNVLL